MLPIDVRPAAEYDQAHLEASSINLPAEEYCNKGQLHPEALALVKKVSCGLRNGRGRPWSPTTQPSLTVFFLPSALFKPFFFFLAPSSLALTGTWWFLAGVRRSRK